MNEAVNIEEKKTDLEKVLDTNIYVKEGSGTQFLPPKRYIEPFLEAINAEDGKIKVRTARKSENINPDGVKENIAFGRVSVEVDFGDNEKVVGFRDIIGMVYSLDTGVPAIRVYSGENAIACTNLCIFNAENIASQNLTNNFSNIYETARSYRENKEKEIEEFAMIHQELIDTHLDQNQLRNELGRLLMASHKTVGTGLITGASKYLADSNSVYHAKNGCSLHNLYQSLTQVITDRETAIWEKPIKTFQIAKMLGINNVN